MTPARPQPRRSPPPPRPPPRAHIDHTTCPQMHNKVQDVSFCRTTQEMSSNWRLRGRTRRTRGLQTQSLHAYNLKLSFVRGADLRSSDRFSFSHLFLALFPHAGGTGAFGTDGSGRFWCPSVQNETTFIITNPELLQPVIKSTAVTFVHYYHRLHLCDDEASFFKVGLCLLLYIQMESDACDLHQAELKHPIIFFILFIILL